MYNQSNMKELYTRSGRDASSEKWSQQFMSDSQDWGTQFFNSQDIQRPSAALSDRYPPFMQQNSSQSSTRGGTVISGRSASQPGGVKGDVYLAREIRFGLHTILSVMRELPSRLKDINEVLRVSQQSEETNCLIKETSEKLEGLVLGLEKKLTALLESKENSDVLQQEANEKLTNIIVSLETKVTETLKSIKIKEILQESLSEHSFQLRTIISEVVRDLTSQSKENEQNILEEQRNAARKEVHRELKKFHEVYNDLKSLLQNSVDERMTSIHDDVTKLCGKVSDHEKAMHSFTMEMKSLGNEKHSDLDEQLQGSFKEVLYLLNCINNKMTVLPQKIRVELSQAVNDVVQNIHIPSGVSASQNVSPSEWMSQHRPMMPFSQRFLRSQVSPIAQVRPQVFQPNTPSVIKKAGSDKENEFLTPISSYCRPIPQNEAKVNIYDDFEKDHIKKFHPNRKEESSGNYLQVRLLNSETQQFSPESVSVKLMSDSEDSILLHCDSGSSSSDECMADLENANGRAADRQEGFVTNCSKATDSLSSCTGVIFDPGFASADPKLHRQVPTPNVRKAPFIIAKEESSPKDEDKDFGGTFAQPLNPAPSKRTKFNQRHVDLPTVIVSPAVRKSLAASPMNSNQVMSRSRRFLTPLTSQGLRFKVAFSKKRL